MEGLQYEQPKVSPGAGGGDFRRRVAGILLTAVIFFGGGTYVRDIIARSHAERTAEAYRTQEKRLQKEIDSLVAGMAVIDRRRDTLQSTRDTLQLRYIVLKDLLYKNNEQLKTYKNRYEALSRYDTLSGAGIRRYFADSLQ